MYEESLCNINHEYFLEETDVEDQVTSYVIRPPAWRSSQFGDALHALDNAQHQSRAQEQAASKRARVQGAAVGNVLCPEKIRSRLSPAVAAYVISADQGQ